MAKNEKQMQKRRQKASARRTQKRAQTARALRAQSDPSRVAEWPLTSCWITDNWSELDRELLVTVLVTRTSPLGTLACAAVLVDLGCLGIKQARVSSQMSPDVLRRLMDGINEHQTLIPCTPELAVRVIETGRQYAESLGFAPCAAFAKARNILDGIDPRLSTEVVPTGRDGKPFFVAGPHDDALQIIHQLTERVGVGGFDYIASLDGFDEYEDADEYEYDDEEVWRG